MTDQTSEQTQPTTPVEFPERTIRQGFPSWDDQKAIQGAYSGMSPQRQAEFVKAVQDAGPEGLTGAVAGFLDSDSDQDAVTSPSSPPEGEAVTPAPDGPVSGGSSEPTPGGQQTAGDAEELEEALDTIETAEDYADANPDRIEALLEAENAREKPRKTLVDSLERAQRRRDREAKQGE